MKVAVNLKKTAGLNQIWNEVIKMMGMNCLKSIQTDSEYLETGEDVA